MPVDRYWGAQTTRSKMNFEIGGESERMPVCVCVHYILIQLYILHILESPSPSPILLAVDLRFRYSICNVVCTLYMYMP